MVKRSAVGSSLNQLYIINSVMVNNVTTDELLELVEIFLIGVTLGSC